jgi:hypothetical protein
MLKTKIFNKELFENDEITTWMTKGVMAWNFVLFQYCSF